MSDMPENLYDVDETEEVARILFAPSMVKEGRVTAMAFALTILASGKDEEYLSVWRKKIRIPNRENVTFPPREKGDSLYGYALLTVSVIHKQDIANCAARVKRKSRNKNTHHVGIYYTLNSKQIVGKHMPPGLLLLLSRISKIATPYPFPPIDPDVIKEAI